MVDAAPPAPADVPPVVAVVVTCDPGWWLEPCLRALVAQDYPQLAVLVIDAGSEKLRRSEGIAISWIDFTLHPSPL